MFELIQKKIFIEKIYWPLQIQRANSISTAIDQKLKSLKIAKVLRKLSQKNKQALNILKPQEKRSILTNYITYF